MRDELVREPLTDQIYLGQSICTVYRKSPYGTCGIWNFGYCKTTGNFYYNKAVHLPQELFSRFEGVPYTEEHIEEMESAGIYNGDDISFLMNYYEEEKRKEEQERAQAQQTATSQAIKKILSRINRRDF